MSHHAPKWFSGMFVRDLGLALGLGALGGFAFRHWHRNQYVPGVQSYYQQYEDQLLQEVLAAERAAAKQARTAGERFPAEWLEALGSAVAAHKGGLTNFIGDDDEPVFTELYEESLDDGDDDEDWDDDDDE
mmetsp:Transcript_19330/g.28804  ORF Transcript_19330/g.28804 Transcript_19330/m.28804 type:complete len:131 (+) Transcript_19330:45-437(+)